MMRRLPALLAATIVAALGAPALAQAAPDRFDIGFQDPLEFPEADPTGAYDAMRDGGAHYVRLPVPWASMARERPSNATDPSDPTYHWEVIDSRLNRILDRGMTPLFVVYAAPGWSDPSTKNTVRVGDFKDFITAMTKRYSGRQGQRPRVRYWQLWNEPNLRMFLDDTSAHYREMLNAGYDVVKDANRSNVVIAGGLGPFSDPRDEFGIAPFPYMRALLKRRVKFDVWSHHPYTSGGPNHSARVPAEASLGDLPEMRRVLRSAHRKGRVRSSGKPEFWVTEFGWDTNPPDPGGVPLDRHARWVAEAMYRMWQSDINTMVWFKLRDDPAPENGNWSGTFQSGVFPNTGPLYRDEREKPVGQVLRFPFVAVPEGRRVSVWGRTPGSNRQTVVIERKRGSGFVRVARVRAGKHGIFRLRLKKRGTAELRARVGSVQSVPFKPVRTPDIRVNAFGGEIRN